VNILFVSNTIKQNFNLLSLAIEISNTEWKSPRLITENGNEDSDIAFLSGNNLSIT
jgi:hypothetical protein